MKAKIIRFLLWRPIEHPVYQQSPHSFIYDIPWSITAAIVLLIGLLAR